MKKTLFIFGVVLVSVFCVLACKNAVGNPSYTVVGVETVQGFIDNPDVFFTDPQFTDIKPRTVLGETETSPKDTFSLLTQYRALDYTVKKHDSQYELRYIASTDARNFPSLKGSTSFIVGKKLKEQVLKLSANKPQELDTIIPVFKKLSLDEFTELDKVVLQETLDYAEILCTIDGALVKYTFRKTYKN